MSRSFQFVRCSFKMWTIAVLSALFLCCSSVRVTNDCIFPEQVGNQADYYWREYHGVIPRDAVSGGYTRDGNTTYIAQFHSSTYFGILVGNIYRGQQEAMTCPIKKFVQGLYVKILCSNPQNKFEWISTTADTSHLLSDYYWVAGGVEPEKAVTYVGRATFEGEVQVGRVFDSKSRNKGLWLCNKDGNQVNFQSFELLVLPR